MAVFEMRLAQTLTFRQTVGTNQHIVSFTDALVFIENDDNHFLRQILGDRLNFGQVLKYHISGHRTITQSLTFTGKAYRNQVGDVYQNLTMTQSSDSGQRWRFVNQSLGFTETLHYDAAKSGSHFLGFNESVHTNFIRVLTVTDQLSFAHYATGYLPNERFIAGPIPVVTPQTHVTFSRNGTVVSLRPPEFDDKDSMQLRRIQRETRNLDLIIYRDPTWSKSEILELPFTYIDDVTTRKLQDFIRHTLGLLVTYTDHQGTEWLGIFDGNDFEIDTPGRFNNTFTIKFEVIFE